MLCNGHTKTKTSLFTVVGNTAKKNHFLYQLTKFTLTEVKGIIFVNWILFAFLVSKEECVLSRWGWNRTTAGFIWDYRVQTQCNPLICILTCPWQWSRPALHTSLIGLTFWHEQIPVSCVSSNTCHANAYLPSTRASVLHCWTPQQVKKRLLISTQWNHCLCYWHLHTYSQVHKY